MVVPIGRGEPTYEWLREQAKLRLSEKFPDLKEVIESGSEESENIITSFVANSLGAYNIPMRLDIYDDATQYKLLKEKGFHAPLYPEPPFGEIDWLYYRRLIEKDYKRAKNLLLSGLDVETEDVHELNQLFFEKYGHYGQAARA